MIIKANGNVGIGTSLPTVKLDVIGDARISHNLYVGNGIIITDRIDAVEMTTTSVKSDVVQTARITAIPGDSLIHIGDSTIIFNNLYNRMYAASTGIYRGIALGTGSIGAGVGSTAIGTNVRVSSLAPNGIAIGSGSSTSLFFNTRPNSLAVGFNSNLPTLIVNPATGDGTTGAVGIATSYIPAGYKLAVEGNVIAQEIDVKLRANWPDYVFKSDYLLPSLAEVEQYIKSNGHLKDIPTAEEIHKEGLSLGEIVRLQMQKIEELTLYQIELEKQLNELKARIK